MNKTVLVTGGAGYIGSHTVRHLLAAGFQVVVLDTLYSGHRWAVHEDAELIVGDAGSDVDLEAVFGQYTFDAIVHFAGHIVVPESVVDPLKYYQNNCLVTENLVSYAIKYAVKQFVFSSSAAVYGAPESIPVLETTPTQPINPYGRTKLISEWTLQDVGAANSEFNYIALRYFNVAGAAVDGSLGQATPEATHLIKVACEVATGKRDKIAIYGTDYPTTDGTCIRDYIHVDDLAMAHVSALRYLASNESSAVFNCGYGAGFSVREVLDCVSDVVGKKLNIVEQGRRDGDPAALVADNRKILSELDWQPRYNDLKIICQTAFDWEKSYNS